MPYDGCPCFWLEQTGRVGVRLRRFTFRDPKPCPSSSWGHDASSDVVDYRPLVLAADGTRAGEAEWPRDDQRWPTACACGYEFADDDHWQANLDPEWRRADGGLIVEEVGGLPPGALFHFDWDPWGRWRDRYGDGIHLHAVCPGGSAWDVDGPAVSDGEVTTPEAWTRTGDPRRPETLSVTPSIDLSRGGNGGYHGFLTAGAFTAG